MIDIDQHDIDAFWASEIGFSFSGCEDLKVGDLTRFNRCLERWVELQGFNSNMTIGELSDLRKQMLGGRRIWVLATERQSKRVVEIDLMGFLVKEKYLSKSQQREATYHLRRKIWLARDIEDRASEILYQQSVNNYECLPRIKRLFKSRPVRPARCADSNLIVCDFRSDS